MQIGVENFLGISEVYVVFEILILFGGSNS